MWTPATWWKRQRMIRWYRRKFWQEFNARDYVRAESWALMTSDDKLIELVIYAQNKHLPPNKRGA